MAKTKDKVIEEEVKTESVAIEEPAADETELFIFRKLAVINRMSDKAKAKRLAERVLMNRKG